MKLYQDHSRFQVLCWCLAFGDQSQCQWQPWNEITFFSCTTLLKILILLSPTEEVVFLNKRHQRLHTGKVEESCRSSVAKGLHQREHSDLWLAVVVVVEHWQWEPLGRARGCLAAVEEGGEQEEDGVTGPHSGSDWHHSKPQTLLYWAFMFHLVIRKLVTNIHLTN